MHLSVIHKIIGILLMAFSLTMLPPVLVAEIFKDGDFTPFVDGFAVTFLTGFFFWLPSRRANRDLGLRDGFVVVVMFWFVLGSFGALPMILDPRLDISITDAVFESFSGLTTTGATVIVGLDELPKALLFYRQELQWLGGMGIIVLAVAIMPMLGIGGMQLYKAETPGPVKDNKLTPRIKETAKALWYIYLGLTMAATMAFWGAGMTFFDALSHAFSTIAIGGFSTHDASIGYFNSTAIEAIAIIFMLVSGVNFGLHFMALRNMSVTTYFRDSEFKAYATILLAVSIITVAYLYLTSFFTDLPTALHHGIFQVVSIGTTTGFTTANYAVWPGFLPVLLVFVSFIGGCAGSTGGGMKVIRFLLLFKQGMRELKRLVHPNATILVKVGGRPTSDRVIDAVWGFFAAYVAVFVVMMLLLMASGLDQITSFSAVAACLNNLGPGLGEVSANFQGINDFSKWVLCIAMLLGRLEIFTLLVILTPAFWRK